MRIFAMLAGVIVGFVMPSVAYAKVLEQERQLSKASVRPPRRAIHL